MSKELIISTSPTEVEIALIENAKLIEIHTEKTKDTFAVGDIFLGSIRKMMPGLNAAFVDIGHRKDPQDSRAAKFADANIELETDAS